MRIIIWFLSLGFSMNVASIEYPTRIIDRPLTLVDRLAEVEYLVYFSKSDLEKVNGGGIGINLRYGLTDNIELTLFGIKYRMPNINRNIDLAMYIEIPRFGYSDNSELSYTRLIGVDGKFKASRNSAFLAKLSEYYNSFSGIVDRRYRLSLTYVYSLPKKSTIALLLGAHKTDVYRAPFSDIKPKINYVSHATYYYQYSNSKDIYATVGYGATGSINQTHYYSVDEFVFGIGLMSRW